MWRVAASRVAFKATLNGEVSLFSKHTCDQLAQAGLCGRDDAMVLSGEAS